MPYSVWPSAATRAAPATTSVAKQPSAGALALAGQAPGVTTSGASGYSTNFSLTENPIVEDGGWTNGTAATDWNAVQTSGGIACATTFNPSTEDDCVAVRSGLATGAAGGHYVEATLYIASGYAPSNPHEAELLTGVTIGPGASITLYEALFSYGSSFQLMRWNGPRSSFIEIAGTAQNGGIIARANGQVCRAEFRVVSGNVEIRVYQDGVLRSIHVDDSAGKLTGGTQAGMGFFSRGGSGAVLTSMGWTDMVVGNL